MFKSLTLLSLLISGVVAYDLHQYLAHEFYTVLVQSNSEFNDISSTGTMLVTASQTDDLFDEIVLDMPFIFFGHRVSNLQIFANGFIGIEEHLCEYGFCDWKPDRKYSSYIAPYMTDLNPADSNGGGVYYQYVEENNVKHLIVQWDKLKLYGGVSNAQFTFQVALSSAGDITFRYSSIPVDASTLYNTQFNLTYPLTMGLSALVVIEDQGGSFAYHPVTVPTSAANTLTSAYIHAAPTCPDFDGNCNACLVFNGALGAVDDCAFCQVTKTCVDAVGHLPNMTAGCGANPVYLDCPTTNVVVVVAAVVVGGIVCFALGMAAFYGLHKQGYIGGSKKDELPPAQNMQGPDQIQMEDQSADQAP